MKNILLIIALLLGVADWAEAQSYSPEGTAHNGPVGGSLFLPPQLDNAVRISRLPVVAAALTSPSALPPTFAPPASPTQQPVRVARLCGVSSGYQPSVGRFGVFAPPPIHEPHPALAHGMEIHAPEPAKGKKAKDKEEPLPEVEFHAPCIDCNAQLAQFDTGDFSVDTCFDSQPYAAYLQQDVYNGKTEVVTQRPLVEWGLDFYGTGPIPISGTQFGITNLAQPKFYVFGDYRVALAQNNLIGQEKTVLANRLNLELDYWFTATERIHAFMGPMQDGGNFTRIEDGEFFQETDLFNADTDTFFFEGDFGQILGGMEGTYAPFDLPVTAGLVPLLFQNGVWALDAMIGVAATVPAQNSPLLDWSNYDVTFFAGFDRISTGALDFDESAAALFGMHTFIESRGGYLEVGYAFVDDQEGGGRSYHNLGMSYTRRYANRISNTVRMIVNAGQDRNGAEQTADGVLLLVENTYLTKNPYNVLPYANFFVGFDRPQPLARAGANGGVLFNTGILFQSDALTGYPTLDATARNTFGAAMGLELLNPTFDQQLFLEVAYLGVRGDEARSSAAGDQVGVGARWQKKLSTSTLVRADAMIGVLDNSDNVSGARVEYRWKF